MAVCLLSMNNWADAAVLSGGGWSAGLPVGNLQDRQVQRVARTLDTAAGSTWLDAVLPTSAPVAIVALVNHNLTQDARWRLRIADDPGFADAAWDSGWQPVWPTVVQFGLLEWGVFLWGQRLAAEEAAAFGAYAVLPLALPVLARCLRLELQDPANAAGYLEAGRLVLADRFQPARGQRLGWTVQTVDPSRVTESRGGQRWFDVRRKRRRVELELAALSRDESYQVQLLDRLAGRTRDVLFVPDPGDVDNLFRTTVLGTMTELPPLAQTGFGLYGRRFMLEEGI